MTSPFARRFVPKNQNKYWGLIEKAPSLCHPITAPAALEKDLRQPIEGSRLAICLRQALHWGGAKATYMLVTSATKKGHLQRKILRFLWYEPQLIVGNDSQ